MLPAHQHHQSLTQQGGCGECPAKVLDRSDSSQPSGLVAGRFRQDLLQLQGLGPQQPPPGAAGEKESAT